MYFNHIHPPNSLKIFFPFSNIRLLSSYSFYLSSLVFASHLVLGVWPFAGEYVNQPGTTFLEILAFPLSASLSWKREGVANSFSGRGGSVCPPPLSMLGIFLTRAYTDLITCHKLVCVHCPAGTEKHWFLVVVHCLWLLPSFCPSSAMIPEPGEEGLWYRCPWRTEHPAVSPLLLDQYGALC